WRNPQQHNLWGNGKQITVGEENKGGVLYNGQYHQNTDWAISANNPCASMGAGWRVPTQDEWERLCNYDSNPSTVGGKVPPTGNILSIGQANTSANSAPLTWVPVKNGKAANNDWGYFQYRLGGFAVYKTADWDDAAAADYKNGIKNLYETAAPEPVLFFPTGGMRNPSDGTFASMGSFGFYWSSTNYNDYGAYLVRFNNTHVDLSVNLNRGYGFSVRCVK
ncbi:MAG: fibrobacter succinogenes major paralogous domain-containing protein, partial [Prevotellaceae bacterium]|nr:fibrobacter succinogenes major paralogous domain-containing protein [Prevotellaceae bacterium]